MQPQNQIFVALDVADVTQAVQLARKLKPWVGGVKVGLELLTSCGAPQVVAALRDIGLPIFFDGKFKDIPNTVAGAVRAVARLDVAMLNVHALGGTEMMQAAVQAARDGAAAGNCTRPKVLAVTVLTSLNAAKLQAIGFDHVRDEEQLKDLVVHLATQAKTAGCDGVVASPQEIAAIRAACGRDFLIVTPGVRPLWASTGDQQRVMTPKDALTAGADYLVIGRPITTPPADVGTPAQAAQKIVEELL